MTIRERARVEKLVLAIVHSKRVDDSFHDWASLACSQDQCSLAGGDAEAREPDTREHDEAVSRSMPVGQDMQSWGHRSCRCKKKSPGGTQGDFQSDADGTRTRNLRIDSPGL